MGTYTAILTWKEQRGGFRFPRSPGKARAMREVQRGTQQELAIGTLPEDLTEQDPPVTSFCYRSFLG